MHWIVRYVDIYNECHTRVFHHSTTATRFVSEMVAAKPDIVITLETCEDLGDVLCVGCGHGIEYHHHADRCQWEGCTCETYGRPSSNTPAAFSEEPIRPGDEEYQARYFSRYGDGRTLGAYSRTDPKPPIKPEE